MAAVNLVEEGVTPTPSETPTETPTETPIAIDTPTATPTVGICASNCNGDASVAINELVTLVNIALGLAEPSQCEAGIPAGAPVGHCDADQGRQQRAQRMCVTPTRRASSFSAPGAAPIAGVAPRGR
jgi:hypothetical protein